MGGPGDIDFWTRIAESSPTIVLVLLGFVVFGGRFAHAIIKELLRRLDASHEAQSRLMRDVLLATTENTQALDRLTETIERESRG